MPEYTLRVAKTGYWEVRWSEHDGTRWRSRSVSTRTTDRREAERFLENWKRTAQTLEEIERAPEIGVLAEAYREALHRKGAGPTQFTYLANIVGFFGRLRPTEISDEDLVDYGHSRGVSHGTLRRELGVLVAVMNHGVRKKALLPEDVPHIELPRPSQPREVFLSADEERDFMADLGAWHVEHDEAPLWRFAMIALRAGARRGAILDLTWDRVDIPGRQIDFRTPGARLSKKRRVPVPVDDVLLPVLRAAADRNPAPEGRVVQRDPRAAFARFRRAHPRWAHVTPHVLRHTAATRWLRQGIPIWHVAGLLGDTVQTVSATYGHHATADLRAAMNERTG